MSEPAPARLWSLDAFRGMTIAGMILVNNPGSWSHVYAPLQHATWHGWTPTDLVFPFFVFIVGVALVPALARRREQGVPAHRLLPKILRRTALLFLFGLLLHGFPFLTADLGFHPRLVALRIPGVLQRIALCYAAAALLWLYLPRRALGPAAAAVLLGYWALLLWVPVPGHGAGQIDAEATNVVAWLDTRLLPGHLYKPHFDPEGILSTLPAIGTCLLGVLAGHVMTGEADPVRRTAQLLVHGALWVVVGWTWSLVLPINKPLWTSSYAVFTAGQAACALALFHWFCDVRSQTRWALPLVVYGRNALLVFVASGMVARALSLLTVTSAEGKAISWQQWFYRSALLSWLPPLQASLAYALLWVGAWFVVLYVLYRRGFSLRV